MKTRNGFVSNSSSTSFVIAHKIPAAAPCKECGCIKKSFIDALLLPSYEDTNLYQTGYDAVMYGIHRGAMEEIEDEQRPRIKKALQEEFGAKTAKYKNLKNEGYDFAHFTLDNNDTEMFDWMQELVKDGTVIILNDEA